MTTYSRILSQRQAVSSTPGVAGRQNEQIGREGLVSIYSGNRQSGTSSQFTVQLPGMLKNVPNASLKPARVMMVSSLYDIPVGHSTFYWREVNAGNVVTLTQTTLTPGCYSGADFAAAVQTALVAGSPNGWPYTVSFSALTGKLTVATNGPAGSRWGFGGDANSTKMKACFGLDDSGFGVSGAQEVTTSTRVIQIAPIFVHIMTTLPTNGWTSNARGPANLIASVSPLAAPYSLNELEITQSPTIIMPPTWPGEASFFVHRLDLDPAGTIADLNGTEWAIELVSAAGDAF